MHFIRDERGVCNSAHMQEGGKPLLYSILYMITMSNTQHAGGLSGGKVAVFGVVDELELSLSARSAQVLFGKRVCNIYI